MAIPASRLHQSSDFEGAMVGKLAARLRNRSAIVAVLGLGYAGMPMAVALARAGYPVFGIDVDEKRVESVNQGISPVSDVSSSTVADLVERGSLNASTRFDSLEQADCVLICVPTPLTEAREPDHSFVEAAASSVGEHLHPGMLIVLQSTCSPGTTRHVLLPKLRERDFHVGEDVFIAFASERIDPGNTQYTMRDTPKVVGGVTPQCTELTSLLFDQVVDQVHQVSSPEVAELSKLVENTFRFVNISFVNEIATLCDSLGLSVWEVLGASATKPFAFMPHYPGPGVGGHCIPVVPSYLAAAAAEKGSKTPVVDAANRTNEEMPRFVVEKLGRLMLERGKSLKGSRVLVLGVAYKPDVSDVRESPGLRVYHLLDEAGANVDFYDPHVSKARAGDKMLHSLTEGELNSSRFDCAVLITHHTGVNYERIGDNVDFVFDTRNSLSNLGTTEVVPL